MNAALAHALAALAALIVVPGLGIVAEILAGGITGDAGSVPALMGRLVMLSGLFAWTFMLPAAALHWLIRRRVALPWWSPPLGAGSVGAVSAFIAGTGAEAAVFVALVSGAYGLTFGVILELLLRKNPARTRPED
ncbi:hypothetical protein [Oceaniglobus roseus]|uniref:hypothetical protein n=1 Tax=Oceaniglobus roseus TaxID=1737570 RepID=UPI000C7F4984|nr:hypothetical protein [Kandeliimicrobium roseum]